MRIRRSLIGFFIAAAMAFTAMAGCGVSGDSAAETQAETPTAAQEAETADSGAASGGPASENVPEDGTYTAYFQTGSTMFYVNEEDHGTGILTVEDGQMSIHIRLVSKSIVNLFLGTSEEAQAEGAELLEPVVETVEYSDGTSGEVNAYDVPVPVLDEAFDVSIIGTHGNWYTHAVTVSLVTEDETEASDESSGADTPDASDNASASSVSSLSELSDGTYDVQITLEGGSGRAQVLSPSTLTVTDGAAVARIEWDSPNYDYMIVGEETYYPVNDGGNSVFEIPVAELGVPLDVIGDTTAMSQPHEIDYTLTFTVE